jgi:uncharacterized protein (TIGR03067 family)
LSPSASERARRATGRNEKGINYKDHQSSEEFGTEEGAPFGTWWTLFRVDTSKDPKAIDFVTTNPMYGVEAVTRGIYELKGETLRSCYALNWDGPRPTEFRAPKGSKRVLAVWRRAKRGS